MIIVMMIVVEHDSDDNEYNKDGDDED